MTDESKSDLRIVLNPSVDQEFSAEMESIKVIGQLVMRHGTLPDRFYTQAISNLDF